MIIAVAGGVFLGLLSCGGYAWHEDAITWSLGASLVVVLGTSMGDRRHLARGLFSVAAVCLLFVATQAGASAFYPGPPESLGSFLERFWMGLTYGPC